MNKLSTFTSLKTNSYLSLHHRWTLRTQYPCRLEHINNTLILHPFQNYTQSDKDSGSAHASTEKKIILKTSTYNKTTKKTHLQCTVIGPSCPNCSFVLCTCPMKSMKPSPDLGTPCSGQSVNWNCRTVREEPSRASVTLNSRSIYCGILYSAIGSTTKHW